MRRLFLPSDAFGADTIRITGYDHQHLAKVLRVRAGEKLVLLDNTGQAFYAEIVAVNKAETVAKRTGMAEVSAEPSVFLTVAQALGKGDKFEQVIQHGTEAGASAFLPLLTERCDRDIPVEKAADRLNRWRLIAKGAAEQSGRARIAEVGARVTFAEWVKSVSEAGTPAFLLHPDAASVPLREALREITPVRLALAVGPEGGWSPAEVSAAKAANCVPLSLGLRVLRTETAALVAISQILFALETHHPLR